MHYLRVVAIAIWFTVFNAVRRPYWNRRYARSPEKTSKVFLAGFREFLSKTPSQSQRRGQDLGRSAGFTLAPITVGGYLRVAKKFVKDERTVFPTKRQLFRRVAKLRDEGKSYTHVCNSASMLEWMSRYRQMPVRIARPRKPERRVREVLTEREIKTLIEACRRPRERALMALSAWSGLRTTELTKVKVSDCDLANLCVTVRCGKYFRDRTVCMTQEAADYLSEYIQASRKGPDDFLFGKSTGSLRRTMHRVRKRTEVQTRATPQRLRRSLATNLHLRGADLSTIKSQMGHKDEATTLQSYIKIGPELHRQKYDRYAPIYQDSQMNRHIEKFVTGEFTFGSDPLSVEASHYKPEMSHLLTVQERLRAYAEALRERLAEVNNLPAMTAIPSEATPPAITAQATDVAMVVPAPHAAAKDGRKRHGATSRPRQEASESSKGRASGRSSRTTKAKRAAAKPAPSKESETSRRRGRPRRTANLTSRQVSVLKALKNGATPLTNALYRKVAEVSRQVAANDLTALCRQGVLKRDPRRGGRSTAYLVTGFGLAAV